MNTDECLEKGLAIADYFGDVFEERQLDFGDLPVTLAEIWQDDEWVFTYYRLKERFWLERWAILLME